MNVTVEIADSASEYLEQWARAMADVHWFHSPSLFDYSREEMAEEIAKEFDQPECLHLVATSEGSDETLGVLKVKLRESVGTLGRWEPAVLMKYRESRVGEALIEKACALLRECHLTRVKGILKFPYNQPETATWHLKLYQRCGFVNERPSSILLLVNLSKAALNTHVLSSLRIVDGADFSLEELADFTQRAFLSTPKDKAVHQGDPYISNRENLLKALQAIKEGKMGLSPHGCWQVAKLNDNVVGFIIAFIRAKSKYQPANGVIAELGAFPEYRRKGIATILTAEIFKVFKKHKCSYSLVGTPKTNNPAIRLYTKMGYTPTFEQVDLQKILTPET
jgi:ribosomal protein S18 acetylase RimI-like enzyme